jgi:hypothetical protein
VNRVRNNTKNTLNANTTKCNELLREKLKIKEAGL